MNKSVVFCKAGDIEKEEENEYGENSESRNYDGSSRKEFVYNPDMDNFKTPGKKNVQEDDEADLNDSEKRDLIIAHLTIWIVSRVIKMILSKFLRYRMRNPLHL